MWKKFKNKVHNARIWLRIQYWKVRIFIKKKKAERVHGSKELTIEDIPPAVMESIFQTILGEVNSPATE